MPARTRSAAAAISSATATWVERSGAPDRSGVPRRSRSGDSPATPMAMSVVPLRKGRPNESVTTTASSSPVSSAIRARIRRALASGSSGNRMTVPGAALEWSTPAEAQTKPCRVSAITSPLRARTTRALSVTITSSWRRSLAGVRPSPSRPPGGLDSGQLDHASLRLGHGLLGDDDRVARAQLGRGGDERAQVVAGPDLWQPLDGQDRDHGRGSPVTEMPAWAR